jgi:hypothetical protein
MPYWESPFVSGATAPRAPSARPSQAETLLDSARRQLPAVRLSKAVEQVVDALLEERRVTGREARLYGNELAGRLEELTSGSLAIPRPRPSPAAVQDASTYSLRPRMRSSELASARAALESGSGARMDAAMYNAALGLPPPLKEDERHGALGSHGSLPCLHGANWQS